VSLSAKDRHALESIEERIAASDRKLASMLDTFTRLTAGEAMPVRERFRTGWLRAILVTSRERNRAGFPAASPASRRRAGLLMVLWAVISIGLVAVGAVTGRSGPNPCAAKPALSCPGHPLPHGAHQAAAPLVPARGRP
jgi:hypothetical protein